MKQTKVTPTGLLILHAEAPRAEWLEARRQGITATDLPAILGLNKYKTAIDVWMEKVAPTQDTFEPKLGESEAALWGIELEDAVARTWAAQRNLSIRRIGIIAKQSAPWMRASLDRVITRCPDGRCGLEVKTRSGYVSDEWAKGVPEDVAAQVRWQLMVSGLDHIHVIALIGGQKLIEHRIDLTGFDQNEYITAATIVWDAVQSGEAPQLPEQHWTDDFLNALHPDRQGEIEVDNAQDLVAQYDRLSATIKDAETERAKIKTTLIGALGEYEVALYQGRPLYSYKSSTTRRLDSKALAELYPDIAEDPRVYNVSTTRTLRITTTKESN